ncbi:MAG: acyl-CoA dehydrogenase [Thaumarchaeota archaeon]|nr:MAG: acyl-CoA dehydrogenase [Nitrososphaerota archaeon]
MAFPFKSLEDFEIEFEPRHEEIRNRARRFAERELKPKLFRIEKTGKIPRELIRKAGAEGFLGIGVPRTYGGVEGDLRDLAIVTEEIARISPAFGLTILVTYLFTTPILLHGTEEQKKLLKKVVQGETYACHAATEPGGGSDLAGIRTTARRSEGGWILRGHKRFISGVDWGDYFLILARVIDVSPERRSGNLTFFIIEREYEGLKIILDECMGVKGLSVGQIIMKNVYVPDSNVLGEIGQGLKIALETYSRMRIGAAALAVGIIQSSLESSLRYSLRRKAFGKPIIEFQSNQFKIVDVFSKLMASRLMLYWAANISKRSSRDLPIASSMAKLYSSEVAEDSAIKAIEIHGGLGVLVNALIERFLRDSEIIKMIEGTGEIQRIIIFRELLKRMEMLKDYC